MDHENDWMVFADSVEPLFLITPSERPILSSESQKLLHANPLEWSISRRRLLISAFHAFDTEQFRTIFNEYVAVAGHPNATKVVWQILENATANELELSEEELKFTLPPSP